MTEVILVIHLLIALALIAVVLLQRSEGGALGMGGGSGGALFSSRGVGSALTRITAFLAVGFFLTSFGLTLLSRSVGQPESVLDAIGTDQGAPQDVLPVLPGETPVSPATDGTEIPVSQ